MQHPLEVKGYDGSFRDLAQAIGRMRYDKVAEFLAEFAKEFERQSEGDKKRGYAQLAELLRTTGEQIGAAQARVEKIWKLCESKMKQE